MSLDEFLKNGDQTFLPNLSIDHVIIGYEEGQLKCLLLKVNDRWMLPGGFVERSESVEEAALRILKERTALEDPHLKFLAVFSAADRQFKQQWKAYLEKINLPWQEEYWINDRFVTLAYYSLVHLADLSPSAGEWDEAICWFPFDELPDMWMDHQSIVARARQQLKFDLKHEQLSYNLLPPQFTMPELHQLHQHILEEKLDRSRFQKNMLASGHFERLPKLQKETPGRNPYLYRVKTTEG